MESRSLVVGIDLGVEYTQICVKREGQEPESICVSPGNDRFLIPTALCIRNDTKDWLFGEDAIRCRNREAGWFLSDLLGKVTRQETVTIYDMEFTGAMLLERFIRKVLSALKQRYIQDTIERVAVTVQELNDNLEAAIYQSLETVGVRRDRATVQNHLLSFMYYAVSQPKELWAADVSLFDFRPEGMFYYQLSASRRTAPVAISAQTADLSDLMDYEMLETMSDKQLAYTFRTITDKVISRQILSAVYVTGSGFEGTWCDGVLRELCTARRVFKGQNLYVKGAAYAAAAPNEPKLQDFLFLTEDMLRATVSIRMFRDNRISDYPLVAAGTKWNEVNAKTVGILDDTDEVFFTVLNAVRKETKHVVMNLRNLHRRENKTTRVSVGIRCIDRDTAVITVKDLGFGQFYPNSYRVWEKVITL